MVRRQSLPELRLHRTAVSFPLWMREDARQIPKSTPECGILDVRIASESGKKLERAIRKNPLSKLR
jgi:hypothetical protein